MTVTPDTLTRATNALRSTKRGTCYAQAVDEEGNACPIGVIAEEFGWEPDYTDTNDAYDIVEGLGFDTQAIWRRWDGFYPSARVNDFSKFADLLETWYGRAE